MSLEWVKFGEYRKHADMYCAFCNRVGKRDELVLMNTSLIPHPWICHDCAQSVSELLEEYDNVAEELEEDEDELD